MVEVGTAVVNPDRVAPSRMVGVSASLNLPLYRKVQEFSSGTGSPGWSRKSAVKRLWWFPAEVTHTARQRQGSICEISGAGSDSEVELAATLWWFKAAQTP